MELNNEVLGGLSDELREKVAACETPEDYLELLAEESVDLNEEQLLALSGGSDDWANGCYTCYT